MTPAAALEQLAGDTLSGPARPFLTRLARPLLSAVAPVGTDPAAGGGAPVGVGGLARRGPWHRLLHSDWALLDEAPLEFLRRAADRELRFTELEREQPAPARVLEVRFDSGPRVLGRPRVVQAAFLLACAAQARSAGLVLRWGDLTDRDPVEGLPADWLDRFRDLRSLDPLGPPPAPPVPAVFRWVVSTRDLHLPGHPVVLSVGEPGWTCTLGGRAVVVGAIAPADSAALLDARPKRPEVVTTLGGPLEHDLVFSPSGARLFCWSTTRDAVWAIPVPSKPGRKIHQVYFRGRLLAVGWIKQKLMVLSDEAGELVLWRRDLRQAFGPVPEYSPSDRVRLLVRIKQHPAREGVCVVPPGPLSFEGGVELPEGVSALDGLELWRDGTTATSGVPNAFFLGHVGSMDRVFVSVIAGGQLELRRDHHDAQRLEGDALVWLAKDTVWCFVRGPDGTWRVPTRPVAPSRGTRFAPLRLRPLGVARDVNRSLCAVTRGPELDLRSMDHPGGSVRFARSARVAAVSPTCKVLAWFDAEGALELFQTCPPARLGRWEPT